MPRIFEFLRSHDLPHMSRPNYSLERSHMLLWGILAGTIEGNTSSIVVAKTFGGSPLLVTVVWATPMLANVLTLFWGSVIRGRARMPLVILLNLAAIASLASVAFTPSDWRPWGGWIFASQIAMARVFLAVVVNVRTSIWSMNYPDACRALITGRLQGLRFLTGLFATTAISLSFNQSAEHYRWVYPLVGLLGLVSLWPARRMRVRAERMNLRALSRLAAGAPARHVGVAGGVREAAQILRQDRPFARYCSAQFFLGSANFMVDPVLAIVVTQRLQLDYFSASAILDLIPNLVMLFTIPIWSRIFDSVGVLRFRVTNSAWWLASSVLAAVALLVLAGDNVLATTAGVTILIVSRIVQGVGRGGGAIAWNLGHLHFAGKHNADVYMSIHVALTGLRGMVMPFVGVGLFAVLGWGSLLIAGVLGVIALALFARLAQTPRSEPGSIP